jgi:hypothetical protein
LNTRSKKDVVTNVNTPLPSDYTRFANKAITPDPDAGIGKITKIVDVKFAAVHHEGVVSDEDPFGTRVKIDAVIQIDIATQMEIRRHTQPDLVFHYGQAGAVQDQLVGQGA